MHARQIAGSEGGLHALVNVAGICPLGPAEVLAEEWHRKVFEVRRCIRHA